MIAALAVTVLGLGMGALGLLESDMYVIGAVTALVGGVGVLVRAVEWARWLFGGPGPVLGRDRDPEAS